MKTAVLLAAAVLSLGCSKGPSLEAVGKTAQDMRAGNTEPVKYVNRLQNDVTKAQEAQKKANQAVGATQQAIDNALKGADE